MYSTKELSELKVPAQQTIRIAEYPIKTNATIFPLLPDSLCICYLNSGTVHWTVGELQLKTGTACALKPLTRYLASAPTRPKLQAQRLPQVHFWGNPPTLADPLRSVYHLDSLH